MYSTHRVMESFVLYKHPLCTSGVYRKHHASRQVSWIMLLKASSEIGIDLSVCLHYIDQAICIV